MAMPLTPTWFDMDRLSMVGATAIKAWKRGAAVPLGVRALLDVLEQYSDAKGVCWPSQARIAEDLHRTTRYVRMLLACAEKLGCVKVVHGHNAAGRRTASIYVLRPAIPDDLAAEWGMPDMPAQVDRRRKKPAVVEPDPEGVTSPEVIEEVLGVDEDETDPVLVVPDCTDDEHHSHEPVRLDEIDERCVEDPAVPEPLSLLGGEFLAKPARSRRSDRPRKESPAAKTLREVRSALYAAVSRDRDAVPPEGWDGWGRYSKIASQMVAMGLTAADVPDLMWMLWARNRPDYSVTVGSFGTDLEVRVPKLREAQAAGEIPEDPWSAVLGAHPRAQGGPQFGRAAVDESGPEVDRRVQCELGGGAEPQWILGRGVAGSPFWRPATNAAEAWTAWRLSVCGRVDVRFEGNASHRFDNFATAERYPLLGGEDEDGPMATYLSVEEVDWLIGPWYASCTPAQLARTVGCYWSGAAYAAAVEWITEERARLEDLPNDALTRIARERFKAIAEHRRRHPARSPYDLLALDVRLKQSAA